MRMDTAAISSGVEDEQIVLEGVRAEASIDGLLTEVTVEQRYHNPEDVNIEAVYTFPLPFDGVLLGFEAELGGQKLAGTVVERSDAERRYEDAITDGDAAILLEEVERGLYTASLGNLLPGERATIRFRYGVLLAWNGDRVRLLLPMTIAPRYGDPRAAGLAPHHVPEFSIGHEHSFSLEVRVRGLLKDARFNSPSHAVSVTQGPAETIIEAAGTPAMDRDFVLEARTTQADGSFALLSPDIDGWVALASFRPEIPAGEYGQRRSVKIVVDCSGSMGGDSIGQARAALERVLDGLREGDAFDIIAFGTGQRVLFGRETSVSETSLARARRFVRALDADLGGTEIGAALEAAYAVPCEQGLPRDVLLITDGEVWNRDEVIDRAKKSGHRIFTVGVGSAVTEGVVRGLAEATGGACELVAPREDIAARIHRHFQRMYAPSATRAGLRWPVPASGSMPESIEPVYGGDTLHVFAWFADKPNGAVRLEVTLADGGAVVHEAGIVAFEERPAKALATAAALPSSLARLGAARRLAATGGADAGAGLAVRYQLVSPWTHCLVVHVRNEDERPADLPKIVKVPQVLAAGWHGVGTVDEAPVFLQCEAPVFPRRQDDSLDRRIVAEAPLEFRDGDDPAMPASPAPVITHRLAALRRTPEAVGPVQLVQLLNDRHARGLPTLEKLAAWGMAEDVLEPLRDLIDDGEDETAVVAAFLHVLAESQPGDALCRPARRRVLEAAKREQPNRAIVDAVRSAFRAWQERMALEGDSS